MSKNVFVVIPHYNDEQGLFKCLNALNLNNNRSLICEVIVVDNGSAEKLNTIEFNSINLPIKFVEEHKAGSYCARNTGLRLAKGKFIALTDCDCIPDRDWLSCAASTFEDISIDRIGGAIEFYFKKCEPNIYELYDSIFNLRQQHHVARGTAVTANLIFRRELLASVGFFDDTKLSGSDINWGIRASKLNKKIVYVENCKIRHPARSSWTQISKKKREAWFYEHASLNDVIKKTLHRCCHRHSKFCEVDSNLTLFNALKIYLICYRVKTETLKQLLLTLFFKQKAHAHKVILFFNAIIKNPKTDSVAGGIRSNIN